MILRCGKFLQRFGDELQTDLESAVQNAYTQTQISTEPLDQALSLIDEMEALLYAPENFKSQVNSLKTLVKQILPLARKSSVGSLSPHPSLPYFPYFAS